MGSDDARGFIPLDGLKQPPAPAAVGCVCGPETDGAAGSGCGCSPAATAQAVLVEPGSGTIPVETQVRQRYDQLASAGTSTLCCSPGTVYSDEELAEIPLWVLELSSGCGSPLTAISLQPGQTVADFGCGAGLDLLIAARKVGPAGRVIGIDGSMHMVKAARRAAKEAGAANIDVRVGDIRRPPLRPASVDVVLSNCVLGMFPDKQQVLSAVADALRPGGVAVISDVVHADGAAPADVVAEDSASADEFARCVVGVTESQYRQMVLAAGFARVEMRSDGLVPYRDGTQVTSATIFAYRNDSAPGQPCC